MAIIANFHATVFCAKTLLGYTDCTYKGKDLITKKLEIQPILPTKHPKQREEETFEQKRKIGIDPKEEVGSHNNHNGFR